jgi:hypothetical protein
MNESSARPIPKPVPWPKLLDRSMATIMPMTRSTMSPRIAMIGINASTTKAVHHVGRPTIFKST